MTKNISKIIEEGVQFIKDRQRADGGFLALVATDDSFKTAEEYNAVFFPALILDSLLTLESNEETKEIAIHATNFLLSQKSDNWTFNYWARQSAEAKAAPYPDDLDDTACSLAALFKFNRKIVDGDALAKFVMVLTALEEQAGGPYRTWLAVAEADAIWKDIDLAVNANVGYFLSLQGVSLPSLKRIAEKAITEKNFHSPYYHNCFSVIYFISRFYKGRMHRELEDFLCKKRDADGSWGNPLDTALAVLALLNIGAPFEKIKPGFEMLVSYGQKNNYEPFPFYVEANKTIAGATSLTAAFCLEAISRCQKQVDKAVIKEQEAGKGEGGEIRLRVEHEARGYLGSLPIELKKKSLIELERTLKGDKNSEIVLLPYYFAESLGEKGKEVPRALLADLGLANLYGWMAYTIYDDFLDGEGKPALLPVANILLMKLKEIFNEAMPANMGFLEKSMLELEEANVWEASYCRLDYSRLADFQEFPEYGDHGKLAEKSLGHILGPLAILFYLGYLEDSAEVRNTISFFKHYLIARQLNDDAHDWEHDLKKGQINSSVAKVLKKWRSLPDQTAKADEILPQLQSLFWHETVSEVSLEILRQVRLANKALEKVRIITCPDIIKKIISSPAESAKKALEERGKVLKFLEIYK